MLTHYLKSPDEGKQMDKLDENEAQELYKRKSRLGEKIKFYIVQFTGTNIWINLI